MFIQSKLGVIMVIDISEQVIILDTIKGDIPMSTTPNPNYDYQIEKGVNKELHKIEKNIIDVARQEFYETSAGIKDLSTALGALKDANAVNFAAANLASSLAVQGSTAQVTLAVRDMAADILADGQKTRDLINSQYATNLAKELNEANMKLIEAKSDDRHSRDRFDSLQNGFNNQQILTSIQAMQSQLSSQRAAEVVFGNLSGTNNGVSSNTNQVH
jgi:hypothetical protein